MDWIAYKYDGVPRFYIGSIIIEIDQYRNVMKVHYLGCKGSNQYKATNKFDDDIQPVQVFMSSAWEYLNQLVVQEEKSFFIMNQDQVHNAFDNLKAKR